MAEDKAVMNEFQPTLSEWFKAIGDKDTLAEAIRLEDNTRVSRLAILHHDIGLPFDEPVVFEAAELFTPSARFEKLLRELGDKPCAIRLVPKKDGLPKLRNRGLPLGECYEKWLLQQTIDPADYVAEVYRHSNTQQWAATFVVKEEGILGEIVQGLHSQLTHGEIKTPIYRFLYNFSEWEWSDCTLEVEEQVERMFAGIIVSAPIQQKELQEKVGATFSHNFLQGYFEATVREGDELIFIDYNRLLADYVVVPEHITLKEITSAVLTGLPASPGSATGKVVLVNVDTLKNVEFFDGDILVCDNTDVRYLPLMKRAGAIVTERGGMLSHAAIVARELGKPCIVGVKEAFRRLKDGPNVEVDGSDGSIRIISSL